MVQAAQNTRDVVGRCDALFAEIGAKIRAIGARLDSMKAEREDHAKTMTAAVNMARSLRMGLLERAGDPFVNHSAGGLAKGPVWQEYEGDFALGPDLFGDYYIVRELEVRWGEAEVQQFKQRMGALYGFTYDLIGELDDQDYTFSAISQDLGRGAHGIDKELCKLYCAYHFMFCAIRSDPSPQLQRWIEKHWGKSRTSCPIEIGQLPTIDREFRRLRTEAGVMMEDITLEDCQYAARDAVNAFLHDLHTANTKDSTAVGMQGGSQTPGGQDRTLGTQATNDILLFVRSVREAVLGGLKAEHLPTMDDGMVWVSLHRAHGELLDHFIV